MGMESQITPELNVDIVGGFELSDYMNNALYREGIKPEDLAEFDSFVMSEKTGYAGINEPKLGRVLANRTVLREKLQKLYPEIDFSAIPKSSKIV